MADKGTNYPSRRSLRYHVGLRIARYVLMCTALWLAFAFTASAQDSSTQSQGRGSNFDPPPARRPTSPPPAPAPVEEEKPFFELREVDWGASETWVKLALLVGSIVLARRAFREMKDDC